MEAKDFSMRVQRDRYWEIKVLHQ